MNENLDSAAKEYADSFNISDFYMGCDIKEALTQAFEAGAQWQKTQKPDLQQMWEQSIQLDGFYTFGEAQEKCPKGYRVPTFAEWAWLIDNTEYSFDEMKEEGIFRFADGFELRLPAAGYRGYSDGSSYAQGSYGYYWSSSVNGISARNVYFNGGTVGSGRNSRANGCSVRCLPIEIK